VFPRSNTGILGFNPSHDIDICVYYMFVLSCVWVAALRRSDRSSEKSYRLCKRDYEIKEENRAQQRDTESLMNE
jgi:hypothetical protein